MSDYSDIEKYAIELGREAESRKHEIEELRNIPKDLMDKVKSSGLIRLWAAEKYGGHQATIEQATSMISQIAYYNASLAWVIGVTGCSSLFSGYLPSQMAEKLYSSPMSMIGGFAGPAGIAEKVDGGLKVKGKWNWGSGVTHCSHIVGGVRIQGDSGIDQVSTGIVFMRPDEVSFIDNWHVLGLKGTHSIDYETEDLFIPDDRWSLFPISSPEVNAPLYRFSFLGALALSVSAVGMGLACRAIDEIKKLSMIKSPFGQGKTLSQRPNFQEGLGKLEADYLCATSMYQKIIGDAYREAESGMSSKESKAKVRLAACHSATLAHKVVDRAYRLAGGSSIWQSNKLEELFRDINVVTQHGMVSSPNYRTVGAVYSGNDVPNVLL